MKRISWEVEEMVAMVDIYYRYKNNETANLSEELKALSEKLKKRADILNIEHDERFRNYNGMKMIFENVRFVDTNGEAGFSSASQLVYDIVELYHNKNEIFKKVLDEFKLKY